MTAARPTSSPALSVVPPTPDAALAAADPEFDDLSDSTTLASRFERCLLDVLLWIDEEPETLARVRVEVDPTDFIVPEHGTIFRWRLAQADRGHVLDTTILLERMRNHTDAARGRTLAGVVKQCMDSEGLPHRVVHYAREVRRRAARRGLREQLHRAIAALDLTDDEDLPLMLAELHDATVALAARLPISPG